MPRPTIRSSEATPSSGPASVAWPLLLALGTAKLLVHLLTAATYGFHRDELYYLTGGRRLELGYVDHPPLVPWLAGLAEALFGLSLRGLHLFPALAGAAMILVTGWMAARLGGGRYAQALAATAVLLCPLYLGASSKFQTVTFDQLLWSIAFAVLVLLFEGGAPRLWLLFGLVAGIGVLTKYTFLVLGVALVLGLLSAPERRHFAAPWIWLGGALALLLVLPNLIWQHLHDWPTVELIRQSRAENPTSPLELLLRQLLLAGPFAFPVFIGGFLHLLSRRNQHHRPLAFTLLAVLGLFMLTGAKPYYAGPIYTLVFAFGGLYLEPRFLRRARPRVVERLVRAAPFLLLLGNLVPVPYFLPVLPPELYARSQERIDNDDFAEMFGWDELVERVGEAYRELPAQTRSGVRLFTSNYGSASALELFGDRYDLPPVASGHNSYYWWTRGAPLDPILAVGFERQDLERRYGEVEQIGIVDNRFGVTNEEAGRPFYLCRGLRLPLDELWPRLRHYD